MNIAKGDYVLVGREKPILIRVSEVDGDELCGKADLSHIEDPEVRWGDLIEFNKNEVVANVGRNPKFGSIYGTKVEVIRQRFMHEFFGRIRIFSTALDDDEVLTKFRKLMRGAEKLIRHHRLPKLPIMTDIRNPHGKYAGWYKWRRGKLDVLTIKVDAKEAQDKEWVNYIVSHEYAHGLWFRYVPHHLRSKWIDLYHQSVTVKTVSKKELQTLLEDLVAAGGIKKFRKELEEESDKKLLGAVLRNIKSSHHLDANHIQLMLDLGEDITHLWPTYLEIGTPELLITEYAGKSPEELWAETFSHWIIGKKLPKTLQKAIDKTLSKLSKIDLSGLNDEDDSTTDQD